MENTAIQTIRQRPQRYDFFGAVRLLQAQFPELPRIGCSKLLQQDPIRFGQRPSLAFAASSIDSLEDGQAPKLNLTSFGLFGPSGPMPVCMTEYALLPESGLLPFADVFHHRLFCLFYRAWESSQKAADLDRAADPSLPASGRTDAQVREAFLNQRFARYLASLLGVGFASLQHRNAVPDNARLYYASHLVAQWRNAEGLETILQDFFDLPIHLEEFVGRWIAIPAENICRLGSPSVELGHTAIAGKSVWEPRLGFRLRVGPLGLNDFLTFLPGQPAFERLRAWVNDYAGCEFIWDLQLVLKADEVPQLRLGGMGQLGWSSFLSVKGAPRHHDAQDVVFDDLGL